MPGCLMPLPPHLASEDLWTKDSLDPDKNEELFLPGKCSETYKWRQG